MFSSTNYRKWLKWQRKWSNIIIWQKIKTSVLSSDITRRRRFVNKPEHLHYFFFICNKQKLVLECHIVVRRKLSKNRTGKMRRLLIELRRGKNRFAKNRSTRIILQIVYKFFEWQTPFRPQRKITTMTQFVNTIIIELSFLYPAGSPLTHLT